MPRVAAPRVPMQSHDEKQCRVCKETRKGFEFWADKRAIDGKQNSCRVCSAEQVRQWKIRNPEKARATRQRRTERVRQEWREWAYGLTPEQHRAMLDAQGHVCALCGRPPKTRQLAVDHDHSTGVIRGLLCSPCNTGLGKLGDSIEGLQRAIDYLRRSENMPGQDITKHSMKPGTQILKQGHTTNGAFGSDPFKKVKGGRPVRDLSAPTAKG